MLSTQGCVDVLIFALGKKYCPRGSISQYTPKRAGSALDDLHNTHDDDDQEEEKWGFRGHCMQLTRSPPGATICGGSQVPSQS